MIDDMQSAIAVAPPEVLVSETAPAPPPRAWPLAFGVGFRFACSYWLLYLLFNGNVTLFGIVPVAGDWVQAQLDKPFMALAVWLGQAVFHLSGIPAQWHGGGSGDTALDYLRLLGIFAAAAILGALWTAIDFRRKRYDTLHAWLRFLLRLTAGLTMLVYGFAKLFPAQMAAPSIAVLNEPLGQSSPMTLLWTMLGFSPLYEMLCGAVEVMAGVLLLIRWTALAGALLTAFVAANIVFYNYFFDVPVKLFATNLLLMAIFLVLPDMGAMWTFFVLKRPSAPSAPWVPPVEGQWWRKGRRIALVVFEWVFLAACLGLNTYGMSQWLTSHRKAQAPSPLLGAWKLDSASPANTKAILTAEGKPETDIYFDDMQRAFVRSSDGPLWRAYLSGYDANKHTLGVHMIGNDVDYQWSLPDPDHLVLTAGGKSPVKLTYHRVPVPASYPLMTRGFHWVNEWGLER